MNNAYINKEYEDVSDANLPVLREQATQLTEVIEALQNILSSNYWKVLQKNVFDLELAKSKRILENEDNEKKIFRLQGEIKLGRRYHLEKLLKDKQDELSKLRIKL